jgi:hypothetical protein
MELPKNVEVYKDSKHYVCTLRLLAVRGGKHIAYVAEDGTILKQEPLFRYTERIKRRKGDVGYAIKV